MSRSIRVAPEYIQQVKLALRRHAFPSQRALAKDLRISRSTTDKFFTGKAIDYQYFVEISERLGLDWEAIAYIDTQGKSASSSENLLKESFSSSDKDTANLLEENTSKYIQEEHSPEKILILSPIDKEQKCADEERAAFVVAGSISKDDISKLKAIAELLQEITGDTYIKIVDIEQGSIKLILEGSQESLKQIEALFLAGQLTEVLKIPVENVQFIDEKVSKPTSEKLSKLKRFLKLNKNIKDIKMKKLAFTIAGNVSEAALQELKTVFNETQQEYQKKFSRQFFTSNYEIEEVLLWLDRLYEPSIPQKIWEACKLAVTEGFTNAVRHAHHGLESNTPIDIEVTLYSKSLEVRIWDQGPGFNLKEKLQSLEEMPGYLSEVGRGLKILQNITDQLSYTRTENNRNCLLIVKNYTNNLL
jgi:serine/threonine-protein kinase RsbW